MRHPAICLVVLAFLASPSASAVAQPAAAPQAAITVPPDANNADEATDWGVAAPATPSVGGGGRTPTTVPGGKVLSTRQVADAMRRNARMILVDAWAHPAHHTLSGAHRLWFAGSSGTFDDSIQWALSTVLGCLTGRDATYPLVFFCVSAQCWESYNATVRAIALGYKEVYWYRGGVDSWNAAHMPVSADYGIEPEFVP